MKKLFALVTLLAIFLFGCQSELPTIPNDQDVTSLEKGRSLNITGNIIDENTTYYGFLDVSLQWKEIKKVDHYTVTYQNALNEKEEVITLSPDNLSCTVGPVAWQQDGRAFNVFVKAYKLKKGNPVLVVSNAAFFTYSGTTIVNQTLNGKLKNIYDENEKFICSDFSAGWNWSGVPDIDHYKYKLYPSWESEGYNVNNYTETNVSYQSFTHEAVWPDNVMLIVWAVDDAGNCLALGFKKFTVN